MQGRTKWALIYATLRLRLSLRRDWGCGPASSLAIARFLGAPSAARSTPTQGRRG